MASSRSCSKIDVVITIAANVPRCLVFPQPSDERDPVHRVVRMSDSGDDDVRDHVDGCFKRRSGTVEETDVEAARRQILDVHLRFIAKCVDEKHGRR